MKKYMAILPWISSAVHQKETRECYFDGFWLRRLHAMKITKIGQDASRILKCITDQIRHAKGRNDAET